MPDDGVRETWGRYASSFAAEGSGAEDRASLRTLVERLDVGRGSVAVDVATGAGYTAFALARAGMRVIGLDPTHEMLLAARAGWVERNLPGSISLTESWAEFLPFRTASVDVLVAHRAPHQFRDPDAWLAESHRVLRPGGRLAFADQSPPDGQEEWHNTLERLRDPTHETARSPGHWRQLVEKAGFTDIRTQVVYQAHDVEDWLDRVDADADVRAGCRRMLTEASPDLQQAYGIGTEDGRLVMRTPQVVVDARRT